jgi:cytochrome b-561
MDEVEQDVTGFGPVYAIAQITGFMAVVLMGIWTGHHLGGFAWQSDPKHEFNWHPLLMTLGMIYLYGNGIMLYRMFRNERKRRLKLIHAGIMVSAFLFAIIGLKAVFDSHNLNPCKNPSVEGDTCPMPNLYSLHSWMGLITIILFLFQWLAGLITFLFPGLASHLKSNYLPIHIFFGLMIFICACATALLGILEKTIFTLGSKYQERDPSGVVANWIGLLIIIFAALVVYLVANPRFKRLTRPEDEMLLNERTNE